LETRWMPERTVTVSKDKICVWKSGMKRMDDLQHQASCTTIITASVRPNKTL